MKKLFVAAALLPLGTYVALCFMLWVVGHPVRGSTHWVPVTVWFDVAVSLVILCVGTLLSMFVTSRLKSRSRWFVGLLMGILAAAVFVIHSPVAHFVIM